MEAALYHPEHGFYSRLQGFGAAGDYVTSPETHPAFGALLGRQTTDLWQALGEPRPFRVVEVGGGSGALARALLDYLRAEAPRAARAITYTMVERSPALAAVQRRTLADHDLRWGRLETEPGAHLVLANEVLDAFAVYRVVVRAGELRELRVGLGGDGGLGWLEAASVPAVVAAYFAALRLLPPEGAVADVNTGLAPWAAAVADCLDRGLALALDYGYPAAELFARPTGTLLTYYRHTLGSDPLVRLGRQDISTHVDFTTLASAAHAAGLDVLGLIGQATLLERLGIADFRRCLPGSADRRALARLVDPRGLGRIRALFLARGLPADYRPAGLGGGTRPWPVPTRPAALPAEAAPDDFLEQWHEAFGPSVTDRSHAEADSR